MLCSAPLIGLASGSASPPLLHQSLSSILDGQRRPAHHGVPVPSPPSAHPLRVTYLLKILLHTMTILPPTDDSDSRLRSGHRIMRPNNRDTNPSPPSNSDFALDHPPTEIVCDTNPPPHGKSNFDIHRPSTGESQLSQPLLSNDDAVFTVIGSTHEGHSTTSPRNAMVTASTPNPAPFHNTFGPLVDGDAITVNSDTQPPETTLDRDDVEDQIDGLFCDADATLATATLDFHLVEDRLQVSLERNLTQIITTKVDSAGTKLGTKLNQALLLFQTGVNNITSDLQKDIQRMDDRLTQLQGSLEHHNSSFSTAIETKSTNTCRLAEEMSALSARVVEHQSHLDHLLSFKEARRQQMDDHVKQMGELTVLISEVKSQSIN